MKKALILLCSILISCTTIPINLGSSDSTYLLTTHNNIRQKNNIPNLILNETLSKVALNYCIEIDKSGNFSHIGLDRSTIGVRVTRENYFWRAVGENLGSKYQNSIDVMKGWTNSPRHLENILDPKYTEVGFAHCADYWVTVFARPK